VLLVAAAVVVIGAAFEARRFVAAHAAHTAPTARARASRLGLAADSDEAVLHVSYIPGSVTLDGDTDDPGWTRPPGPARTHAFLEPNGVPARPFSEVRALWGDGHLYFSLYAADNDIRSRTDQPDGPLWLDDSFRVTFTQGSVEYVIEVSPRAVVTDSIRGTGGEPDYSWNSGVHVSRELDGTLNDSRDDDEEWVIEMAVPFESIGLKGERGESIGFSARRCDTPKEEGRTCAAWGEGKARGRIVLE
jgi:hypothetical protein